MGSPPSYPVFMIEKEKVDNQDNKLSPNIMAFLEVALDIFEENKEKEHIGKQNN